MLIAALSIASAALAGGSPAELYTLNCWGCHKPRAEGIPGTVPRLADSMADFLHVPGGREYLVEVPGVAASTLSDAEIAQVLNWLLFTFNKAEMPADFKPYTAAEIAKDRPHQLIRIIETRDALVKRLKAKGIVVPDDQLAGETLAPPPARR
ncbi:MAG TPA: c-type cytochrome [Candidatus Binataceae bacterium]|nr:c-type cytochrome [Candidatus Binataceae bacterium]